MYSISSATHITTTKDFNQSFFPELSAGANVVVSGSGIGTGVYSRSSDRGEFDRTVPVGVGFVKVFWSDADSCLLKATGVAGDKVEVTQVPATRHIIVAQLTQTGNKSATDFRFSFAAPVDMLFSDSESIVPSSMILHPYNELIAEKPNECLVLQRNDVFYADSLTLDWRVLSATLVFYSVPGKSICTIQEDN